MMRFACQRAVSFKGIRGIASFDVHPSMEKSFGKPLAVSSSCSTEILHTDLSNGSRVVTHDMDTSSACVGIYVKAGATYDPKNLPGMNYALRWCFLGSNIENSIFQNDKAIRSVGASYEHIELRKKLLAFKVESSRDAWKTPFSHLLSCMAVPRFAQTDILKIQDQMENATEEQRWKHPRDYCIEQVEQLAFKGESLGNPRHIKPYFVDELSSKLMQDHWAKTFSPSRVTIVGVNVDHQELVACCEEHTFTLSANAPHFLSAESYIEERVSTYQGGNELEFQEKRDKEMSTKPFLENETVGAIAWKAFGTNSIKKYASFLVLHQLLAIALQEAMQLGGQYVDRGIQSFYIPYGEVGLFGMTYRDSPTNALSSIKKILAVHQELVCQPFAKEIIKVAKSRARARLYHDNFELRRDYSDFLALNNFAGESLVSSNDLFSAIESVSMSDLKRACAEVSSSSPCMYNMGDVYHLPSLRQLGVKQSTKQKILGLATTAIST